MGTSERTFVKKIQMVILSQIPMDEFKTVLRDCIKMELSASAPSQSNEKPDYLITENEARDFLRVSKVTLKKWRDDKKIPFYRIGSRIRYKRSELLSCLETIKKYGRAAK